METQSKKQETEHSPCQHTEEIYPPSSVNARITITVILYLMLLIALAPMPYGYYTFMKIALCVYFVTTAFKMHKRAYVINTAICIALLLLYQPIIKYPFNKETWSIINLLTIVIIIIQMLSTRNKFSLKRSVKTGQNHGKSNEPFDEMIDMLRDGCNPWAKDLSINGAYNIVSEIALKTANKERSEIIAGFTLDGLYKSGNERLMLALLLNKLTWDMIPTGRFHLYRGILNETGQQLKKLFFSTKNLLKEDGILEHDMAETWLQALQDDIAQAG